MGGSSVSKEEVFRYECVDYFVAKYADNSSECQKEIKRITENVASSFSFLFQENKASIAFQLKNLDPNANTNLVEIEKECKDNLDCFFTDFISIKKDLSKCKTQPNYCFIKDNHLSCNATWDMHRKVVRITGDQKQVQKAIGIIQDLERCDEDTLVNPGASSCETFPHPTKTFPSFQNHDSKAAHSSKLCEIGTTPTHSDFLTYNSSAVRDVTSRSSTPDRMSSSTLMARKHIIVAKDKSIGHFIRIRPRQMYKLESKFQELANVDILDNKQDNKVEFHFSGNVVLSNEDFISKCESVLEEFLSDYRKVTRTYTRCSIEQARQQNQNLFFRQPLHTNDTVYYRWMLDECKLFVSGLKEYVEAKLKECDSVLQVVDRELYNYEIVIKSNDVKTSIGYFIKSKHKHRTLLQNEFDDRRVFVSELAPGEIIFKFKAKHVVYEDNVGQFKTQCHDVLHKFFEKFDSKTCQSHNIRKLSTENEGILISNDDLNVKLLGPRKLKITGIAENVDERFNEISELIRVASKSKRFCTKKCKEITEAQFLQHQGTFFQQFQSEISSYSSVAILPNNTFRFDSVQKLDDIENREFQEKCDQDFQNFSSKFSVAIISTNSRNVVSSLRKTEIDLFKNTSVVHIVTLGDVIKITGVSDQVNRRECQIKNIISEKMTRDKTPPSSSIRGKGLLGDYPISKAHPIRSQNVPHYEAGNYLRKKSVRQNEEPKDKIHHGNTSLQLFNQQVVNKKSSQSHKQDNTKTTQPMQHIYTPKAVFKDQCELVGQNVAIFNELKAFCSELCDVQLSGNKKKPFLLTPMYKWSKKEIFAAESIAKIELFFSGISVKFFAIEPKIIEFLKTLKPNWPENMFLEGSLVNFSLTTTNSQSGLLVKGLTRSVEEVYQFLENQFETKILEKAYSLGQRRVFVICKEVEKMNAKYDGIVKIDCSLLNDFVLFKGTNCLISTAQQELEECRNICKQTLVLNKMKSRLLDKIINENCWPKFEEDIFKTLNENNIEGTVGLNRDGKIELYSSNENMVELAVQILDNSIYEKSAKMPNNLPSDVWENSAWKSLIKSGKGNEFIVCKKGSMVRVASLNSKFLEIKLQEIWDFFLIFADATTEVKISEASRQCYEKFHTKDVNINVVVENEKVYFKGKHIEIKKALSLIEAFTTKVVPFKATLLSKHFKTDNWMYFKESIENKYQCAITHETEAKNEVGEMDKVSQKTPDQTKYGNIFVEVVKGDISLDSSNIIVNGVMPDFNLSRGAISSTILKRAGPEMQSACDSKCVIKKPNCRVNNATNSLRCDFVLHLVTPTKIEQFASRIKEALDVAELLGNRSIAIPTLGAGGIGLDCQDVASCMSQAFEMFAAENPTNLKQIKVVVYSSTIVPIFSDAIVSCKEMLRHGVELMKLYKSRMDNVLMPETVNVTIVGDDTNMVEKVEEKVQSHVCGYLKINKKVKDEVIGSCGDNEKIDICAKAMEFGVQVEFQQSSNVILISGLKGRVGKLSDVVKDILSELKQAIIISKNVVWKWKLTDSTFGTLYSFPIRASVEIEKKYENGGDGTCNVKLYKKDLKINFRDMTFGYDNLSGTIKRSEGKSLITEDVPTNWDNIVGKPWAKVRLDSSSSEYIDVLNLFKKSLRNYCTVIKIERIQNPVLYNQYQIHKRDVDLNLINEKISERQLFHGTSEADADKICVHGFDRGFAGKNATVYGRGVYFAVNSSYSNSYCQANNQSQKFMFLAKVLTGDFCLGSHSYIVPPPKPSINAGVRQEGRLYDSVVDNPSNPTIFVVFKDTSVYPSYLITFK